MIQRSHFVILVIQVKGSRSLLQTRFSLFVIAQILLRDTTTTYNLAGNSSRGLGAIKSSKSQRWFKGPSFLSQSEDHWPKQISAEVNEGDLEVKPAVSVNVTTIKQDLILQLKRRMSNWEKMRKLQPIFWSWRHSYHKKSNKGGQYWQAIGSPLVHY